MPSGDGEEIKLNDYLWITIYTINTVVLERFSPSVNMDGYQDEEGKSGLNHVSLQN